MGYFKQQNTRDCDFPATYMGLVLPVVHAYTTLCTYLYLSQTIITTNLTAHTLEYAYILFSLLRERVEIPQLDDYSHITYP